MTKTLKKTFVFLLLLLLFACLYACAEASGNEDNENDIHIHEYGEWRITEPTCTEPGERRSECECGEIKKETLPARGHTLTQIPAKAPTCTETGNYAYWYCTVCQKKFADRTAKSVITDSSWVVEKIAHSFSYHTATESTCVKRGNEPYCDCLLCGGLFSVNSEHIPLTEEEVFHPLAEHVMIEVPEAASSCSEEGVVRHWYCSACKKNYAEEEGVTLLSKIAIDKKEHTYVNGVCTACGEKDSYLVKFETDGGIPVADMEVKKNQLLSSYPITAKEGYSFCGWYKEGSSTPLLFDADTIDAPITLYAHYLVSSTPNLIVPVTADQKSENVVNVEIRGYTKERIYLNVTCTKTVNFNLPVSQTIFFIKYVPMQVTVELDASGGYFALSDGYARKTSYTVPFYSVYTIVPEAVSAPIKRGFTLQCWKEGEQEVGLTETPVMDGLEKITYVASWYNSCAHKNIAPVAAVEPACLIAGNVAYYHCPTCNACYLDEDYLIDVWDVGVPATGHVGGVANCKEKAVCEKCGTEYGEKGEHIGGVATCISLAVCEFCHEEYGEYRPHYGGAATCSSLAVCSSCGQEYGDYGDHVAAELVCEESTVCAVCGYVMDAQIARSHTYEEGVCVYCGATEALSFAYDTSRHGYLVTGKTDSLTSLSIPARIEGVPVIGISGGAFSFDTELTAVIIPSQIRYFDDNAFYGCTSLSAVYIDDLSSWSENVFVSVESNPLYYAHDLYVSGKKVTSLVFEEATNILSFAFSGVNVGSVEIKEGVAYLGKGVFSGVTNQTDILIRDTKTVGNWDEEWQNGCKARVLYGYAENLLPGQPWTFVSDDYTYRLQGDNAVLVAYAGTETRVVVPDEIDGYTVVGIGMAFAGNNTLEELVLPSSLTSYSSVYVSYCSALVRVYTPESFSSWQGKGMTDHDGVWFKTEEECVHDQEYLRYRKAQDGSYVLLSYQTDNARYARCDTDDLFEPLLCAVCKKPVVSSLPLSRAHSYENGVCVVCGEPDPAAQSFTGTLVYEFDRMLGGYVLKGYEAGTPVSGQMVIPSLYNGKPVVEIASEAFSGCGELTSVYIPRSVQKIGADAFKNCSALATVVYDAEKAEVDGKESFFTGASNRSVTIGKHVQAIPQHLFSYAGVTAVTFEADSACERIGDFAFAGNEALGEINLPASIKEICFGAFKYCSGLGRVNAPGCTLTIGRSVFAFCANLQSFITGDKTEEVHSTAFFGTHWYRSMPDGVVYLGKTAILYKGEFAEDQSKEIGVKEGTFYVANHAFSGQPVEKLTLPSTLKDTGAGAFSDCAELTQVIFNALACEDGNEEKLIFAGAGAENGFSVTFGADVKKVPAYLFYNAEKLTSVSADRVEEVGKDAFAGTAWLSQKTSTVYVGKALYLVRNAGQKVEITEGILTITENAFAESENVKEIVLPASLKKIALSAFDGCVNVEKVTYNVRELLFDTTVFDDPDDIVTPFSKIGASVGWKLVLGSEVTVLPDYVFCRSENLSKVEFSAASALTTMPEYAFSYCPALTEIVLSDATATIEDYAFYCDTGLKKVSFGENARSVSGKAFGYCPLEEITSSSEKLVERNGLLVDIDRSAIVLGSGLAVGSDTATAIDEYAFYKRSNLVVFTVGDSVLSIGLHAFDGCEELSTVILGANVTTISPYAFYGCVALKNVRYNAIDCADVEEDNHIFEGMTDMQFYVGEDVTGLPSRLLIYGTEEEQLLSVLLIGRLVDSIGEAFITASYEQTAVCYDGSAEEWANVNVGENNVLPAVDKIWFYSFDPPLLTEDNTAYQGRFWRYVNGVVTLWKVEE